MLNKLIQSMMRKTIILSNVAEGMHADGKVTFSAAAAITPKYLFGKTTTTAGQIALAGSGNTSTGARAVGVITDEADATNDPVSVMLMGASGSTLKALAGGSIAIGDQITSDTNSKAVSFTAMTAGAGTFYIYGIALTAAGAGDTVEFIPTVGITATK